MDAARYFKYRLFCRELFFLSSFILFVHSMYVWPLWKVPLSIVYGVCLVCAGLYILYDRPRLQIRTIWFFLLFLVTMAYQCIRMKSGISSIFYIPLVCIYSSLSSRTLFLLVRRITDALAVILIPAIIIHVFVCLLNPDPPFLLDFYQDSYGVYGNYFFDLVRNQDDAIRFNGPFVEPGYLGMITSFLLFANLFNIRRWPVLVLLIANIMTLSIAAYVLTLVGLLFVMTSSVRKFIFVGLILGLAGFLALRTDSEIMEDYVLSRLERSEDRGISGNNRVSAGVYYYIEDMGIQETLFGYGNGLDDDPTVRGSGILFYSLKCGIMGVVLWVLTYLSLLHTAPDRKFAVCMFLLMCISLVQRFYPGWFSWLLIYFYAVSSRVPIFHHRTIKIKLR